MREEILKLGDPTTLKRKVKRGELKVKERVAAANLVMSQNLLLLKLVRKKVVSDRSITSADSVRILARPSSPINFVIVVTLPRRSS